MIFDEILSAIQAHDTITLFRHENPDCDAVGSQFGLRSWLQENFPEKHIYALGKETCTQSTWPQNDIVNDETVKESLAIVLDCANIERVDDKRFTTANKVVKIDHHPDRTPFGDFSYVNTKAAATCQILSEFMQKYTQFQVSKQTATYLYKGLLTDTLNYTTSNTTADTLRAGAYLAEKGIDLPFLARDVFDKSFNGFRFGGFLREHVIYKDGFAYVIIKEEDQKAYHLTASKARSFVDELGHVKDFQIWALFTETKVDGQILYDGSLRSKVVQISDVAEKYGGGGHKNASGVKNLSEESLAKVLCELQMKIA